MRLRIRRKGYSLPVGATMIGGGKQVAELPTPLRSYVSLRGVPPGLPNVNNTCYANALFQLLRALRVRDVGPCNRPHGPNSQTCLECLIKQVLNPVVEREMTTIDRCRRIRDTLANEFPRFIAGRQHDVMELLRSLRDRWSQIIPWDTLFQRCESTSTTCTLCNATSVVTDFVNEINVNVDGPEGTSLVQLLRQRNDITEDNVLWEDNAYRCATCGRNGTATQFKTNIALPDHVLVVIQRYAPGQGKIAPWFTCLK